MPNYNSDQIFTFTSMAEASGPYFFSIFFALVMTGMSHYYMRKNMKRKDPPASELEKKIYIAFFVMSILFAFFSSGIAVWSWLKEKNSAPRIHTFQIVIKGVDIDKTIVANDNEIYLRTSRRDAGPRGEIQDYYYVIMKNKAFPNGKNFSFYYYPDTGSIGEMPKAYPLVVTYSNNETAYYKLVKNGNDYNLSKEN